jgi:hypothetical protein
MGTAIVIMGGLVSLAISLSTFAYRYHVAKLKHVEAMEAAREQARLIHDDKAFHTLLSEKHSELINVMREVGSEIRGFREVARSATSEVAGLKKAVEGMPTARLLLASPKTDDEEGPNRGW